ncbi:MAG: DNA translocase FtsK 4TM domain-containing protein [Halofilum sp. (in: g-proteobacteria)]|nr:DNA translocase FtsK 4TM domain-containing protein [Halofilum sp. (in: g-proteobacteria)]
MAQARKQRGSDGPPAIVRHVQRGLREGAFFLLLAISAYLLLSLLTFNTADPGWSHTGTGGPVQNAGGHAGAWFADIFLYLFGYIAYLIPVMVAWGGWLVYRGRAPADEAGAIRFHVVRWAGFLFTLLAACGLASLHFAAMPGTLPIGAEAGGVLGGVISIQGIRVLGLLGSTLLLLALLLAAVTLFTGISWFGVMDALGRGVLWLGAWLRRVAAAVRERLQARRARQQREQKVARETRKTESRRKKAPRIEPVIEAPKESKRAQKEKQIQLFEAPSNSQLPALSLLDAPKEEKGGYSNESLEAMSRLLEHKLEDFNISAEVVAVHPGPVITRFELQPAAGVKVSAITNLSKDLARSMSVVSVRVVEVIPGKPTVGLEIPNEQRQMVRLSEVLRSQEYDQSKSPLTLALGQDISGQPVVADLQKMPHLLVAGTTGSGKSVAVNAMLLSLLYKAQPKDVRLILIDPKMLELNAYEGIPHLLAPVVTDMKEAANALRWCVAEMERRYKLMASQNVRNIAGFNRKVQEAIDAGEPIKDPFYKPEEAADPEAPAPTLEPLPYIVVVIDEFADMMMVVGKKVEELIARIAQKARAAGIHLLLATQRPSVDVITGLIKANIPTRMAFQVSSRVDSRTILDQQGAEQLLGNGDMLYVPAGTSYPQRVHGAFVDDHEVHAVVESLKKAGPPAYNEAIIEEQTGADTTLPGESGGDSGGESDALYDEAVAIVTESRKASISYVQRRLKIGYNRAARIVEDMESAGVVSPVQSNGAREVVAPAPPKE